VHELLHDRSNDVLHKKAVCSDTPDDGVAILESESRIRVHFSGQQLVLG